MITVELYEIKKKICAFTISGHANSGPYGYDLVCAGVSAVVFGAVNALLEIGQIEPEIEQQEDGGYLSITIPKRDQTNQQIQTILQVMVISLQTIENDYHQFIPIKRK